VWRVKFCVRYWRKDILDKGLFYCTRPKLWNASPILIRGLGDSLIARISCYKSKFQNVSGSSLAGLTVAKFA